MFFPISPAFDYVEIALNWFWPVVLTLSAVGLWQLWRTCRY